MAATKESGKNLGLGSRERRSGRWVQNPGSETLISDHKTVRRTTTLAKTTASILPSQQEAHSWWCCSSLLQGDRCRLQRAWKLPSSSSKECSPAKRISILEKTRSRLTGPQLQHSYGSGYGTRCLFDPESGIEDGTKKVTIISHHCYIKLIFWSFSHISSTYSANDPDTVGRHQKWEVPAPTFTFTPKPYTHFMPIHNFICYRRSFWSLAALIYESMKWSCNHVCWRVK